MSELSILEQLLNCLNETLSEITDVGVSHYTSGLIDGLKFSIDQVEKCICAVNMEVVSE